MINLLTRRALFTYPLLGIYAMIGLILLLTCTKPLLVALGILILADALLCLIVAVVIRIRERRIYNTEDEEGN